MKQKKILLLIIPMLLIGSLFIMDFQGAQFLTENANGGSLPIYDYTPTLAWESPSPNVKYEVSLGQLFDDGHVEYTFDIPCSFNIWNRLSQGQVDDGVVNDLESYSISYSATVSEGSLVSSYGELTSASSLVGDFTDTGSSFDVNIKVPLTWSVVDPYVTVEATLSLTISYILKDSTHLISEDQTKIFVIHGGEWIVGDPDAGGDGDDLLAPSFELPLVIIGIIVVINWRRKDRD